MGIISSNQNIRVDTILYLLSYPQTHLVKTKVVDIMGLDKMCAGNLAQVAITSFSGYDI